MKYLIIIQSKHFTKTDYTNAENLDAVVAPYSGIPGVKISITPITDAE